MNGKYDFELNMEVNDTNPIIINRIHNGSSVLEFGSANGRMTQYLVEEKKCIVDIVEIDGNSGTRASLYARHSCVGNEEGNIELFRWYDKLQGNKYDYIVFADVLEHLHIPKQVLVKCIDLLAEKGKILVSLPNIAHNAIIANLLDDEFEYHQTGLLDSTHVHFFTYKSANKMFEEVGLYVCYENYVIHNIEQTEFGIKFCELIKETKKSIEEHVTGNIYQFIFELTTDNTIRIRENVRDRIIKISNYFVKIFYTPEIDELFTEEKSEVKQYVDDEFIVFEIHEKIKAFRIDLSHSNVIVKIEKIEIQSGGIWEECEYVTNAYLMDDGIYLKDEDFQVVVKEILKPVEAVRCRFNIISAETDGIEYISGLVNRKNDLLQQNGMLEEYNKVLIDKIEEYQSEYQKLTEDVIRKNDTMSEMQKESLELQKIKSDLEIINLDLERRLTTIYNSKGWKVLQFIKKICFWRGRKNG